MFNVCQLLKSVGVDTHRLSALYWLIMDPKRVTVLTEQSKASIALREKVVSTGTRLKQLADSSTPAASSSQPSASERSLRIVPQPGKNSNVVYGPWPGSNPTNEPTPVA